MTSEETLSVMSKIQEVTASLESIGKNAEVDTRSFKFKYINLNTLLGTLKPELQRVGLNLIICPSGSGFVIRLTCLTTGQWVEYSFELPYKQDPQGWGGAQTYSTRYALMGIFNIESHEDDDGETAKMGKPLPILTMGSPEFKLIKEQMETGDLTLEEARLSYQIPNPIAKRLEK